MAIVMFLPLRRAVHREREKERSPAHEDATRCRPPVMLRARCAHSGGLCNGNMAAGTIATGAVRRKLFHFPPLPRVTASSQGQPLSVLGDMIE
jgi:hypothetical protein